MVKNKRTLKAKKTIALVAHDHKKDELINWVKKHRDILTQHNLIATGTTGKLIEQELGVDVQRVLSGPLGGDQQLGSLIAVGKIDMVIFFWDPMESQPHDSDVKAFLRLCVLWNVPTASNSTSADFLMSSRYMNEEYEVEIPNFEDYLTRNIKKGL